MRLKEIILEIQNYDYIGCGYKLYVPLQAQIFVCLDKDAFGRRLLILLLKNNWPRYYVKNNVIFGYVYREY